MYGPQDSGSITQSVESVELSTPQQPEFKIPIRDIVFHTTLLGAVSHRGAGGVHVVRRDRG